MPHSGLLMLMCFTDTDMCSAQQSAWQLEPIERYLRHSPQAVAGRLDGMPEELRELCCREHEARQVLGLWWWEQSSWQRLTCCLEASICTVPSWVREYWTWPIGHILPAAHHSKAPLETSWTPFQPTPLANFHSIATGRARGTCGWFIHLLRWLPEKF